MDSFRVDFAITRGHELILEREQPITRDELDAMELQMLRGNRIPFLLPVEWADIDGFVSFRYSIEGRRMLTHQLQLQPMGMNDFYAFLLAVAEALDECKSYLLRPECCLLREPYLFVGDKWEDVSLLYVPLSKPDGQERQAAEGAGGFASLVLRLAAHVHNLDGDGLQLVLKHLNEAHGFRPALKRTLLLLLGGQCASSGHAIEANTLDNIDEPSLQYSARRSGVSSLTPVPMALISQLQMKENEPAHQVLRQQSKENEPGHQAPHQLSKGNELAFQLPRDPSSFMQPQWDNPMAWGEEDARAEGEGEIELNAAMSRSKWLLLAACVIATALVWRYGYASKPSEGRLFMSAGITLCIIAGGLGVWRNKLRKSSGGTTTIFGDSTLDPNGQSAQDESMYWPDSRLLESRSIPHQTNAAASRHGGSHSKRIEQLNRDGNSVAPPKEQRQSASSVPDATVWMGKSEESNGKDKDGGQAQATWQLERRANGRNDTIHLFSDEQSKVFQIGRFAEKVNYADEHTGISRVHVELDRTAEGWMAKDMGSRNGTTLNGNPMISYKKYKLQDGDALQLAGSSGPTYTVRQLLG
ncbi:DUF6382 domain-containing protein [Paenibacillus sp. MMS18-CY102]|uniref:DUF6382 domain-containing protein n=1 Tax=Paenibacillus sp. MMS18-CY102 TaxID=2682849 RepID=UPI0013656263|nr:DUF6382 domain-containing protein [Paenibacillus sp. MMS18-CY102]MWC30100.1 FHA domain-containing protein [Paenibacillus sp. MMS18-CY102]